MKELYNNFTIIFYIYTYFCQNCKNAMIEAGIKKAVCFDSDTVVTF